MSLDRDEMLTTAPPPAVATIRGATSLVSRKAWVTLNRNAVSKKRSEVCRAGAG